MRIHKIVPKTRANGPGIRYCIWVQGCSLQCGGCVNPQTHDFSGGYKRDIENILNEIDTYKFQLDGVSISGGEPMDQAASILELVAEIKDRFSLSIILWTGYNREELTQNDLFSKIARYLDVAIIGRFDQNLRLPTGMRGSANQEYFFFSSVYNQADLDSVPIAEIQFGTEELIFTGINPEFSKRWFKDVN